jgi:hypothetical protein
VLGICFAERTSGTIDFSGQTEKKTEWECTDPQVPPNIKNPMWHQPSPWPGSARLLLEKEPRRGFPLTGGCSVRYAQAKNKTGFFGNVMTVLSLSHIVGEPTGPSGSKEPVHERSPAQKPPKWKDRRIILDQRRVAKDLGVAHETLGVH